MRLAVARVLIFTVVPRFFRVTIRDGDCTGKLGLSKKIARHGEPVVHGARFSAAPP
jgi:hypothetical protein